MSPILRTGVFILCLCLGLTGYTAKALAQTSQSQAAALFDKGDYSAAYEAYGRLLREDPSNLLINLGYARSALRAQKSGHAVMAYERMLAIYPNEPMLLKELAYALNMQKDKQRSNMELAKTPHASAQENAALSKKWDEQHSKTQFHGKIRTGLIYDSNVNNGPASNQVSIGRWDLSLIDGKAVDSLAGYLGAHIDVTHRVSNSSPWWLVGSGTFYARYNASSQAHDIDLGSSEWLSGSAGMRYLSKDILIDIRARAQIFDYAFLQNVIAIGPEATLAYALNHKVHLITRAQLDLRDYSENHYADGWYGSVGQYVRFFMGDAGHNVTLGGRYLGSSAHESFKSYDGFEASLDFTFMLPAKIRLMPFISYSGEYYHGPATALDSEHRQDHRFRVGFNLSIPVSESWDIELGYNYMNNASNSDIYTYDQHLVNAGVAWSF